MAGNGVSGPPAGQALAILLPPARLALVRTIAGLVVLGPLVGTIGATLLAVRQGGVSPWALWFFVGAYCLSTLGVTVGFHRHFAHRSFRAGPALQAAFVILGSSAAQGPLLFWVSTHRRHHQFSDTPDDPHSPHFPPSGGRGWWRGFLHGHLGWMFSPTMTNAIRFAPDIIRDRRVFNLQQRYALWIGLTLAFPPVVTIVLTQDLLTTVEVFLWAGPVRLLLVHHASWAVGSLSHLVGARPFRTDDRSTNNWWVALFAFGEGLQNNHHAFPRAARHAFQWWEPDISGLVIQGLAALGLLTDLNRPTPEMLAARRRTATLEIPCP